MITRWLNESTLTLSACEQLQPVRDEAGNFVTGYLLADGTFKPDKTGDPPGPDIQHEPIPGQVELPEDDPRVLAFLNRRVKTVDQLVESIMNSLAILAIRVALDSTGEIDNKMRAAIRQKIVSRMS